MTTALEIIRHEHQALSAMLRSLSMLLATSHRRGTLPDFGLLRAMLFYIDEFPERLHHPKESELLFPPLLARAPHLADTIARLERDHAQGVQAIRDLQHALLAFEVMGEARRAAFEGAAKRFITDYLEHMAIEEIELLPAAVAHFDADDWAALDAAFAANRDPLTGHEPEQGYEPLFDRIAQAVPSPFGPVRTP